MQHASKFQLIKTTTYLLLSISLDKIIINILTKYIAYIKVSGDRDNNLFVLTNFIR